MSDFKQRLKEEHAQLSERKIKLDEVLSHDSFMDSLAVDMQDLLTLQSEVMGTYDRILKMRLEKLE